MAKKYYIDACIWRDYFENRSDRFRPLGEWAFRLIKKIIGLGDYILYSELVVRELQKYFSDDKIKSIFSLVPEESLLKASIYPEQTREARFLARKLKIPKQDALHAILARDNKAIMISTDHHYDVLTKIVETYRPQDLI